LQLTEHQIKIPCARDIQSLSQLIVDTDTLPQGFRPVRFIVSNSDSSGWQCEIGGVSGGSPRTLDSIFNFRKRRFENNNSFTTALLIPTGVGAEVGGHAGDAGPVAKLLGQVSDQLILHPNVVNASDINEMPSNSFYVEGSVICQLLMGCVGLQRVHSNRVLVVIDDHKLEIFKNAAINSINGARATYGLNCPEIICLDPPVRLRARFSDSGRAAGRVEAIAGLIEAIESREGQYDAIAVSSVIDVPHEFHQSYFDAAGEMVNPWGGVEAILTHSLSMMFGVPTAHSPMFESPEIADMDPGIVDPRMAAEAVSATFMNCTLKGLQQSPKLIQDEDAMEGADVISAKDISCLVIPDGCLGLPVLAAMEQGIKVIAVSENMNIMKNDLSQLPWQGGQFIQVKNYWEAAGVISAIRSGIAPESVRRPFGYTKVTRFQASRESPAMSEKESAILESKNEQSNTGVN
tara:strand:+ start:32197 stop:33582 length:1386 start_codon:yes stop_codon:yes gene_type:complete